MRYMAPFIILYCATWLHAGIITTTQSQSTNSTSRTLVFDQYSPVIGEELLSVMIGWETTIGYEFQGVNTSSSNYTVTYDFVAAFELDPPGPSRVFRRFETSPSFFAPAGTVIQGRLGSFNSVGDFSISSGSTGFSNFVGPGTLGIDLEWSAIAPNNQPTFSDAVDPIGAVSTVTVAYVISQPAAVPEPSSASALLAAGCLACLRRRRRRRR